MEELQRDVDEWIDHYNQERPHSGKYCYGKTPMQTFHESRQLAHAKELDNRKWWSDNQDSSPEVVGNLTSVK